jgi:hypothetical protein
MSVPNGGQEPTVPGGETPPVPPAPPVPTPDQPKGPDGEPFDAERARRTIEAQRAKERELTAKLKELEPLAKRAQELEDAQKTELEKAQAKVAALEAQVASAQAAHRDALIRAAIEREAHAQGAVKADVVYRLVDATAIELAEDGTVKGADKAVKALLDAEPYLKAQATNGHAPVPPTSRADGPPTRDQRIEQANQRLAGSGRYSPL